MENKEEMNTDINNLHIADEVVSTVAGLAAVEVEGVAAMSGGWGLEIAERLGKKNFSKGIKVEVSDNETKIDIYISVRYGFSIPKVAADVQAAVKAAVETMTGLKVAALNIHVVSVAIEKNDNSVPTEAKVEL